MSATEDDLFILPAGKRLREYEIRRVLGRGGFGITYLAHDTGLDQLVAIKESMPKGLAHRTQAAGVTAASKSDTDQLDKYRKHFMREAQALARFDHPSIVRVLASFEANRTAYTVMRFEEGAAFEDYLRDLRRAPTEAELRGIFASALDGVVAVHRAGLLHRDISAHNILVRPGGDTVLIDFGSVRDAISVGNGDKVESSSAQTCTDGYSPPEVYTTGGIRGPMTDIYGLGAVLYRAVSGSAPPSAPDRQHGLLEHETDPMSPAVALSSRGYSVAFLSAIDWALKLRAKDRPQSVEEWRAAVLGDQAAEIPVQVTAPVRALRTSPTDGSSLKLQVDIDDPKLLSNNPGYNKNTLVDHRKLTAHSGEAGAFFKIKGRKYFWISLFLILFVLFISSANLHQGDFESMFAIACWGIVFVTIPRWHDRNKSGY